MVSKIQFINKEFIIPVVIIGVLLLLLFLWKERHSTRGKKFLINALMSFLAITSLMLITLKPAIVTESEKLEIAVLTENYKQETLDSLKKDNKQLIVKNYQKGKKNLDKSSTPTQVFVLGNGIEEYDLWQLKNTPTKYLKGSPIAGITRLKYNSKLSVGDILSVKGLYNLPQKGNKLYLEFPNGVKLDSIVFTSSEKQKFDLKNEVKIADKFVYSLVERDSLNKIIKSNSLPIEVRENETLKVLIINSFPTFDTKYLKNFLAESGHKVIVRNKLTREKYKYEYFNTKREQVSISTNYLNDFDVLVIDATSFFNLSSKQKNSIKNAVEKNGLGVFVQPDDSFFASKNRLISFEFLKEKSDYFIVTGIKKNISKYNYIFKENNLLEPIHREKEKVYSAFKYFGKGRITSTVAQQTYQLVLSGNSSSFKQFWTEIINATSKKQLQKSYIKNTAHFAFLDEPFSFELQTNIDKPNIENNEGNRIPLMQDINQSDIWFGKTYPKTLGWNQIYVDKDSLSTFSFYTMNQDDYKSLRAYRSTRENKKFLNKLEHTSSSILHKKLVNPIWFFLLFLLSIGYLWVIHKL